MIHLPAVVAILGSIVFFVFWLVITPVFSLIACLIAPLPPLWRYHIIAVWSQLSVAALRLCCGIRYRVVGAANIPPTPAVFISRHESAWETIAYQCILPPQVFVLKRQLLQIPFFGWGLRQMSPIAINRSGGGGALRQLREQGRARLAAGFHVVIFPEGTRMPPGESRAYFPGGAWLAKDAGVPVIPIAVDSGRCWGKNSFIKRPGLITLQIGEAIDTRDKSVEEINHCAKQWISQALK